MVEGTQMNPRENILARIGKALCWKPSWAGNSLPSIKEQRAVLPSVDSTTDSQWALFQKNAIDLRADFHLARQPDEVNTMLRQLGREEGWRKVAAHKGPLSEPAALALGLPVLFTDAQFDKKELALCDAGITECDALVAQTGSIVVTSRSSGGRALSCLPPHHVVLARREQLVPDLPDAFDLLQRRYDGHYPSMISFITGPSRTGDIERILVLGAHGPKKLTVFVF
jgi:L-lactate dehydrogenase complex protein LldG